ncbi:MAG: carboxypeptidase M32 [Ardenticatenales bacterium]|nr:carboxypeptidase M32 [Ardenticatenales bacterium]
MSHIDSLKSLFSQINDVYSAASLLSWDQETYMPKGAGDSRSRTIGTLSRIAHEMSTSDEFARALEGAEQEVQHLDEESDEALMVWWARHDFEKAIKLPADFVHELSEVSSRSTQVWQVARKDDDFERFAPWLERMVALQQQAAEYLGYEAHPYDALLDQYEPEITHAEVKEIFDSLRRETVPMVHWIAEHSHVVTDEPLRRHFDEATQWRLAREVTAMIGYDYEHGRLDPTAHPFCSTINVGDVRITGRAEENFFNPLFFGSLHEAGHGIYEQGLPKSLSRTPIGSAASTAMHESQSRLWENTVGRSHSFWEFYYPKLQAAFPQTLDDVSLDDFYKAINKVTPTLIRVEADEVTYNLHVMLRFELESKLISGELAVADLPQRWNEKMEEYLEIVPQNNANGVLQDIHWSIGLFGYFPTYALGNVIASQLAAAALREHPTISDEIRHGDFSTLFNWMHRNVHQQGRRYHPEVLIARATGEELSTSAYLGYLRNKFGDVYGLNGA